MAVGRDGRRAGPLGPGACPVCGITFYEFRNQGRLGCPDDYVCFKAELEPLIVNIHGETEHVESKPLKYTEGTRSSPQPIRLRCEMKEAIGEENYAAASQLRDEIRAI